MKKTSTRKPLRLESLEYRQMMAGDSFECAIPGDSNHDGVFDSNDIIQVLRHGEFEDGIPGNSTFEEGDWNGDGDFDVSDLVYALSVANRPVDTHCQPADLPNFSIDDMRITEGDFGRKTVEFDISRTGDLSRASTVEVFTEDDSARHGSDYLRIEQSVTFGPQESRKTVQLTIFGNQQREGDRSFDIRLRNPIGAEISDDEARVTIVDDDPPPSTVEIIRDTSVDENQLVEIGGSRRVGFSIIRRGDLSQSASVDVYTQDVTATANLDYRPIPRHVVHFRPGESRKSISILIHDDFEAEGDETFRVIIDNPTNIQILDNEAIATITDEADRLVDDLGIVRGPTVMMDVHGNGWHSERNVVAGLASDVHLAGDLNGDRVTDIAFVRENHVSGGLDWYVDLHSNGHVDYITHFGLIGDKVLLMDWDGDRRDNLVAVRDSHSPFHSSPIMNWFIDTDGRGGAAEVTVPYGLTGDTPLAGDLDGDGRDEIIVTRPNAANQLEWYIDTARNGMFAEQIHVFGAGASIPVLGDWNHDGKDEFGVVNEAPNSPYLHWTLAGAGQRIFGLKGDKVIVGNWRSI